LGFTIVIGRAGRCCTRHCPVSGTSLTVLTCVAIFDGGRVLIAQSLIQHIRTDGIVVHVVWIRCPPFEDGHLAGTERTPTRTRQPGTLGAHILYARFDRRRVRRSHIKHRTNTKGGFYSFDISACNMIN
jgi:hypothetical protein